MIAEVSFSIILFLALQILKCVLSVLFSLFWRRVSPPGYGCRGIPAKTGNIITKSAEGITKNHTHGEVLGRGDAKRAGVETKSGAWGHTPSHRAGQPNRASLTAARYSLSISTLADVNRQSFIRRHLPLALKAVLAASLVALPPLPSTPPASGY